MTRTAYVACHDSEKKISLWTSYHLTPADLENPVPRKDNFAPDPDLQPGKRAELADYRNSGYHRGHLAPADDMAKSREIMDESFYLSNMVPQNGSMNSGKWRSLESRTQKFALKKDQIWVITGPIFDDLDQDGDIDPSEEIGPGKVWKPAAMYKIIVYPDGENVNALAFIMPNKKPPTGSFNAYASSILTTIDEIESRTGLDFLNLLDDNIENAIESTSADQNQLNKFLN